jgi:hypothetical protein
VSSVAHDQTGKDAGGAIDAGPTDATPGPAPTAPLTYPPGEPVPIESLFEVMYTPDEALPDKLRRRIRFRLKNRSRAPIALHHIIDIPKPDGSREVFALYESSVYEDCVQGFANRKAGRDHCLGELVDVFDGYASRESGQRYRYKQVRLNRACVALGAVRAVFGPPGARENADTGGSLAITSIAFPGALCEVRSYNHLLVADVDGDQKLEMYVDITTAREELGSFRGSYADAVPIKKDTSRRYLYVLSGDNVAAAELSLDLGDDTARSDLAPEELVELNDIDRDGHLDVIQTVLCFKPRPMPGEDVPCDDSEPRERIAYLYDVKQDSYKEGVAVKAPAEKAAPTAAREGAPAPDNAPGTAPEAAEVATPAPVPPDASRTVPEEAPVKAPSGAAPPQAPSAGAPPQAPSGEAPEHTASGSPPSQPRSSGTPAHAPSSGAPAHAPSGGAPTHAPSGGAPTQAPSGEAPPQAPAGGTPAQPPAGGAPMLPPSGKAPVQPPSGGAAARP